MLSRRERHAITEAISLANTTMTRLIEGPTAAAQVYALEKHLVFADRSVNVIFVDIGATCSWAAAFNFAMEGAASTAQQLSVFWNASLGGNDVDARLATKLFQKFEEQFRTPVEKTDKLWVRFLDEAKRVKEFLTLNRECDIRMEDVIDDKGLTYRLSRWEFEEMFVDFADAVGSLYAQARERGGLLLDEVDSIELIGGMTRVPLIKRVLEGASHLGKLNRTINSDEALAVGSAYVGANVSKTFIVTKTRLSILANTQVKISHQGADTILFNATAKLTDRANYTFPASANHNLTLITDGAPYTDILVKLPDNTSEDAVVTLEFSFNEYTLPHLMHVFVNGTRVPRNYTTSYGDWALTPDALAASKALIARMDDILAERKRVMKVRNDFESHIYRFLEELESNPTFQIVVNESTRDSIVALCDEDKQWLHEDGPDTSNETILTKKFHELKSMTDPVRFRADEYLRRPQAWRELNATLNHINKTMTVTWPVMKPWLTIQQRVQMFIQYNQSRMWFDEMFASQESRSEAEDPVVTVEQIIQRRLVIEHGFNQTNKLKKPTPPSTPKPSLASSPKPTPRPPRQTTAAPAAAAAEADNEAAQSAPAPEPQKPKTETKAASGGGKESNDNL
jgi:molecular chaperone DnaK (HSP70)